jgi:hypothetical protein
MAMWSSIVTNRTTENGMDLSRLQQRLAARRELLRRS